MNAVDVCLWLWPVFSFLYLPVGRNPTEIKKLENIVASVGAGGIMAFLLYCGIRAVKAAWGLP